MLEISLSKALRLQKLLEEGWAVVITGALC